MGETGTTAPSAKPPDSAIPRPGVLAAILERLGRVLALLLPLGDRRSSI